MKAYSLKISGRLLCGPPKENALWKTKVSVFMPSWPSWVVLFVLLFVSNRRVDLKTDINKSTSVSVSVEDTVSLSPSVVTTRAYSAGDDTYQAFFRILQNASCYQKFNQNARSYSHDYEAHSITLRFADDASQNLLFTVYSDGVCQVNGKFVFLRSPDGNAKAIYQLLRDAVV